MEYQTPDLQPIIPSYQVKILREEQLSSLKSGTLKILEEIGVHCPSKKAMTIYAEHGGWVDFETQIVRLPPELVLSALAHAPRHYTLGSRKESHDLHLDGKRY
jgi:trimethylamine--corrinoid protein Co-methyltransferase